MSKPVKVTISRDELNEGPTDAEELRDLVNTIKQALPMTMRNEHPHPARAAISRLEFLATRASAVEPGEAEHLEEARSILLIDDDAYGCFSAEQKANYFERLELWRDAGRIRRAKR